MGLAGERLATKRWIRHRVGVYARRVSLGYLPLVVFSPEEWKNRGLVYSRARLDEHPRGYADASQRAVMIAFDEQLCRHDANDSAVHEVAHLRWQRLGHGERFYRIVKALREGTRCGPKGSRLPEVLQ